MDWEVLHFTLFQSTPPVKAATVIAAAFASVLVISIHAAREGGDGIINVLPKSTKDFNPRRP